MAPRGVDMLSMDIRHKVPSRPATSPSKTKKAMTVLTFNWAPLMEPSRQRREAWKRTHEVPLATSTTPLHVLSRPSTSPVHALSRSSSSPSQVHSFSRLPSSPVLALSRLSQSQSRAATPLLGQADAAPRTSLARAATPLLSTFMSLPAFLGWADSAQTAVTIPDSRDTHDELHCERKASLKRHSLLKFSDESADQKSTGSGRDSVAGFGSSDEEGEEEVAPRISVAASPGKFKRLSLVDRLLESRLGGAPADRRSLLMAGRVFNASAEAEEAQCTEDTGVKASMKDRAAAIYSILSKGTDISTGPQLAEAFLLLDIPYPNEECLQFLIAKQLHGVSSLDKGDFINLVTAYEDTFRSKLEWAFKDTATWSDFVTPDQVPNILAEVGLELMPGASRDIKKQLQVEHKQEVKFALISDIFEDACSRAGLTVREHRRLSEEYEFNEELDGMISADALTRILMWDSTLLNIAGPRCVEKVVALTTKRMSSGRVNVDLKKWNVEFAELTASGMSGIAGIDVKEVRFTGSAMLAAARFLHDRIAHGLSEVIDKVVSRSGGASLSLKKTGSGISGILHPTLSMAKALAVVEEIGILGARRETLEHFIKVLGCSDSFSFDQLYSLIQRICERHGFTDDEEADLANLFARFDGDGSGTLEAGELGPVIRWLGYTPTQFRVYSFAVDFGLEMDSSVNLRQFRKMVASYSSMSLLGVRAIFMQGRMPGKSRAIKISDVPALLEMVGYEPTVEEVKLLLAQQLLPPKPPACRGRRKSSLPDVKPLVVTKAQLGARPEIAPRCLDIDDDDDDDDDDDEDSDDKSIASVAEGGPLDFVTFKKLEVAYRKDVRKSMEENGGVNKAELTKLKKYFKQHCTSNAAGDIFVTQKAMRDLLLKLYPSTCLDRTRHVRIAKILKEADRDGNGMFDFEEFLCVMNQITEDMDRDGLIRGLKLKDDLGFSSAEVKQFKDLFQLSDEDGSGQIGFKELIELLSALVNIEQREAVAQLQVRFDSTIPPGANELDFFGFLTLLRNLQHDNWQNINGVAKAKAPAK